MPNSRISFCWTVRKTQTSELYKTYILFRSICICIPYIHLHIKSLESAVIQFSLVQSLSHVRLSVTPWIAARQASLSITNSRCLPKPMSIESVMPSSHLILCRPLLQQWLNIAEFSFDILLLQLWHDVKMSTLWNLRTITLCMYFLRW